MLALLGIAVVLLVARDPRDHPLYRNAGGHPIYL
jgi:hypothetical protein